jgi:hypothetical protein
MAGVPERDGASLTSPDPAGPRRPPLASGAGRRSSSRSSRLWRARTGAAICRDLNFGLVIAICFRVPIKGIPPIPKVVRPRVRPRAPMCIQVLEYFTAPVSPPGPSVMRHRCREQPSDAHSGAVQTLKLRPGFRVAACECHGLPAGARGAVHVVMPDLAVAIRPADDDPLGANDCVGRRCDGEGQQQRAQGGSQAISSGNPLHHYVRRTPLRRDHLDAL